MAFTWTGETHSTSTGGEPIEIGTAGKPGSLQAMDVGASEAQAQVQVSPASSGPAAFGIDGETQPGVANTTPGGKVTAGPNQGVAVLKAMTADGIVGFTSIDVYPRIALSCDGEPDSAPAYTFASGGPVPTTDPAIADIWLVGPSCGTGFSSGTPGLYVARSGTVIVRNQPFFQLTVAPSQFSGEANYSISTFAQGSSSNAWGLEFGTAGGNAVKLLLSSISCDPLNPSCSNSEFVEGLYLVAQGGAWTY